MYEQGNILADRYEVIAPIGKGGMASVYKALDIYTKTIVAVKVVSPEIVIKPVGQERFVIEKESFAKLGENRNVVKLFDVIQSGSEWFIVLECIEGGTLKEKFQQFGAMTLNEIKYYFSSLCDALFEAHSLKIVHRDIKPDNVLLTPDGQVKLSDFGISVIEDISTEENKAIGTPKYMPPEVIAAQRATPQSDIYSLGIMLYECATGIAPFIAKDAKGITQKHLVEIPTFPRLLNPAIPQSLENIILKMIEKNPIHRYQTMEEIKQDILKVKITDNVKPYTYHKRFEIPTNSGLRKIKVGTNYDKLPAIGRTKYTLTFSIIFFVLLITLLVVLMVF